MGSCVENRMMTVLDLTKFNASASTLAWVRGMGMGGSWVQVQFIKDR